MPQKKQVYKELNRLTARYGGVLVSKKARKMGIHPQHIHRYIKDVSMRELMPGVYALKEAEPDVLFVLQQRYSKGIYSHETALCLWGLMDAPPPHIVMTFPRGYNNAPYLKGWNIQPKYTPRDRHEVGMTTVQTKRGNDVRVYDIERSLCEMFQKRHNAEQALLLNTFKRYAEMAEADREKLLAYAKLFRVETRIRPYVEILL